MALYTAERKRKTPSRFCQSLKFIYCITQRFFIKLLKCNSTEKNINFLLFSHSEWTLNHSA